MRKYKKTYNLLLFKHLIIFYCTLPTNLLRHKYGTNKRIKYILGIMNRKMYPNICFQYWQGKTTCVYP